jgi:hypothetical protein
MRFVRYPEIGRRIKLSQCERARGDESSRTVAQPLGFAFMVRVQRASSIRSAISRK